MQKRLTVFVEGETDELFFRLLVANLFKTARKKVWSKERLDFVPLDGICNAEAIIENAIADLTDRERFSDTVCLIHDTDAFEYQKKPPVHFDKVKRIAERNGCCFFSIPVSRNVEDMIAFSLPEIRRHLNISPSFSLPRGLGGLETLKKLYKEAGKYYIKGHKSEDMLRCLDYPSISKKYCSVLKPLCDYLELDCVGNLCRIRKKERP